MYKKPNFIIIGAQKSASTFLQLCISDHPDVYMVKEEIPYFEDPDYEIEGRHYFENLFFDHNEIIRAIKRPNYLCNPVAAHRISLDLPDAKLAVVLRDPVERFISAYFHYIRDGFIPNIDINIGIKKLINRSWSYLYPRSYELLEFSLYGKHLHNYENYLSNGKMVVLFHERIKNDPNGELSRVFQHLNILPHASANISVRPQKAVYNYQRLYLYIVRNRLVYKYNKSNLRLSNRNSTVLRIIAKQIEIFDWVLFERMFGNQRPIFDRSNLDMLNSYFSEDRKRLYSLLAKYDIKNHFTYN